MRRFRLGSSLILFAAAACGRVDTSGSVDGPGGAPADCDADRDGFFHPHPTCDDERAGAAPDCDDTRASVHPGAALVCGDGVVNDCTDFGDTAAAIGVAEVGKIAEQAIFRTDPDGFFNNVSIAAEGDRVVMAGAESARTIRLVHARVGDATTAVSVPVTLPTGVSFANHTVDVIRRGPGTFEIGTVGRSNTSNNWPALLANFSLADPTVAIRAFPYSTSCPTNVDVGGQPFVLRGLDDDGQLYYELEVQTAPPTIWGVATSMEQGSFCRSLAAVGANPDFGSQIVATGGMAIGRSDSGGVWVWEGPLNYDDLHTYATVGSVNGVHGALARDTQAGEPVLLAYQSDVALRIEAIQCTGLAPCTPIANTTVAVADTRDLVFAPIASGAMLIQVRGDFSGPTNMVAQLLDAEGKLLGGGVTVPLGEITQEYRAIDAAVVPPGIGADYYDIFVGYAVADPIAMQHEMRVRQVRACQAK